MERLWRVAPLCRITNVGAEAWRLLNSPGFCGTVLAVTSNTVYLQGDAGEVFWLQKGSLPMHRRCVRAPFPTLSFEPGRRFSVQKSCLRVGEQAAVDLAHAARWSPNSIKAGEEVSLVRLRDRIRQLLATLPELGNPAGFGQALPVISAIGMDRPVPPCETDAHVKGAINSIANVAKGCLANDLTRAIQKSREFIGLGRGLTPSGDDFVGALFFALRRLQKVYPEEVLWDGETMSDFIAWAANKTNPISHTLLSDLAFGEGPEPLHELFNAVVSGKDLKTVWSGLGRLIEIGSTSGWDMLTGFMTGMLSIEGSLN
jgi:hypothetical protein